MKYKNEKVLENIRERNNWNILKLVEFNNHSN